MDTAGNIKRANNRSLFCRGGDFPLSDEKLLLSNKYKAFLRCDAPVEFLEGT